MKARPLGPFPRGLHRTVEEIRSILDWQRASGLSLLAFARKQGLCYATLRRWRAVYGGPPGEPPRARPRHGVAGRATGTSGRARQRRNVV